MREDSRLEHHSQPVCLRITRLLPQRARLARQLLLPVRSGTLPLRRLRLATTSSGLYSAHHSVVSNLHSGKHQHQRLYQPFTSSNPSPFGPNLNTQSKTRSLNPSLHLCLFGLDSFLSARLPPPSLHIYVLQFQGQAGEIVYHQLLPLPIGERRRRSSSSGPRCRR